MNKSLLILAITTSLLTFLYLKLSFLVIQRRRAIKCAYNNCNDEILNVRIRAHANFSEYVPLAIILMAMSVAINIPLFLISIIGACLLLGRYIHAVGLLSPHKKSGIKKRALGMLLTLLSLLILSVYDFTKAILYLILS